MNEHGGMLFALSCVLVGAVVLAGCGDDDGGRASAPTNWGPLAVIEGPPNSEEASVGGVLDIGENCATVGPPGSEHRTTIAWPSEVTGWNGDAATISYPVTLGDNDEKVELASGDEVSFGGGHVDASSTDWLVHPDTTCPGPGAFYVGEYSEGFEEGP